MNRPHKPNLERRSSGPMRLIVMVRESNARPFQFGSCSIPPEGHRPPSFRGAYTRQHGGTLRAMGRFAAPFLVAVCFLATFAAAANAATPNTWTALGPSAAQVLALAASPAAPGVLYAATEDQVWKSANGGQSWTATTAAPTALAQSMVADPADGDAVIAAATDCTAWVSSDGGTTWAEPLTG